MIITVDWSSCKVPVILVRFKKNLNFLNRFSKNTHISNIMRIRPAVAQLFRVNGQTDMTKLIDAFRSFVNAPKAEGRHGCFWLLNYYLDTQRMMVPVNLDTQHLVGTLIRYTASLLELGVDEKLKVDTHYTDVTWDHVTSDAVSKMGSLQLSAQCLHCSHVTW
jgi:hypothetical protein